MEHLAVRLRSTPRQRLPKVSRTDRVEMEEALQELVHAFWPVNTRREVMREFGLGENTARRVCEGRASKPAITRILRHPNGEYAVGLWLLARVIGRELDPYLDEEAALEERERDERMGRIERVQSRLTTVMHAAE